MKKLIILSILIFGISTFVSAQSSQESSNLEKEKSSSIKSSQPTKQDSIKHKNCNCDKKDPAPAEIPNWKKRWNGIYEFDKNVTFDFNGGNKVTVPKWIKTGEFYRVIVESINLNNYRVELNVKDTVYYSKALDFPVFGAIDISSLEGIVGTFTEANQSLKDFLNKDTPDKSMGGIKVKIDESSLLTIESELNKAIYNDPEVLSDIEKVLNNEEEVTLLLTKVLKENIDKINQLSSRFLEARVAAKAIATYNPTNPIDPKSAIEEGLGIINNLELLRKQMDKLFDRYTKYFEKDATTTLIKDAGEPEKTRIPKNKAVIDKLYAEIKSKISIAQKEMTIEKLEKNIVSILQLYKSTTYTSLPIQFTGEEAEIKMSFIPKDSTSNLQTYHLSPIKFGRSRWYWAVGPGMYYSELQSKRVGFESIQVNDSTQNFNVLKETPLEGEIGVSALFHAGSKLPILSEFIGVHGSVGTGISLGNEIRARMLYGLGLSLGRKNHLTANIGFATGYVDELSSSFMEEDYGTKLFTEKPSVLVKKLDTALFYNVGYVFTF